MSAEASRFAGLVLTAARTGRLKSCTLYKPAEKELIKAKAGVKKVGGVPVLQLERFWTEGRLTHENIPLEKIPDVLPGYLGTSFRQADLLTQDGSASLMISAKGKVTLLVKGELKRPETLTDTGTKPVSENNRAKNRLLTGEEDFLRHLGVSDENGRVHDKRQSKFRQICRFVEYIREAAESLPKEGKLYVADLCCGKSYLSFAVYYFLKKVQKREVSMDCMDLKTSVMEYCSDIAKKCSFDGMHFWAGDVTKYEPLNKPHLVVSLHACDVATDVVLERACSLRADVILATPCCHRQLSRELDCEVLKFVGANSVLKSKMCDALTDALRVLRLEAEGYKADAVELIDPEDTPKNVLIRAHINKKLTYGNKKALEYKNAYKFLTGKDAPLLSGER